MSHNPYSPPEAPVGEAAAEHPRIPRPRQIEWASWCLWASVVVGFATLFLSDEVKLAVAEMPPDLQGMATGAMIALFGVLTALYLWFIARMRAGRNWARVVLLIFSLLGLLSDLTPSDVSEAAAMLASRALDVVLQIAAIVLMFGRASSEWFRQVRSGR
jgi:hypothetical protein